MSVQALCHSMGVSGVCVEECYLRAYEYASTVSNSVCVSGVCMRGGVTCLCKHS